MIGFNLKSSKPKESKMMTLYVNPYRRVARMRRAMDQLLEADQLGAEGRIPEMQLALDVRADDDAYNITALIPGVEAEDISIEVLDNTVSIQGEFTGDHNEGDRYLMSELPIGRFSRQIKLPTKLDASKAEASLKNGVFNVRVPKSETHRPKVIKIAAG
jgi:HSP20 family protein